MQEMLRLIESGINLPPGALGELSQQLQKGSVIPEPSMKCSLLAVSLAAVAALGSLIIPDLMNGQ